MRRTWTVEPDAMGHLPPHDEASLVALVVHAARVLAPTFDIALVRRPLRQCEHERTSDDTYALTTETVHGEHPAVRWFEKAVWKTDSEGSSSNDDSRIVVTAEGLSSSAVLRLSVDARPIPLPDARLVVEATLDADDGSRVAAAAAVLDQCFGAPHEH